MLSERVQRRIDRLLDEAEEADDQSDWPGSRERANRVLVADPDSEDARVFLEIWMRLIIFLSGLTAAILGTIWATLLTAVNPTIRSIRLATCDSWPSSIWVVGKVKSDRDAGLRPQLDT
jgi:hypothetical protein